MDKIKNEKLENVTGGAKYFNTPMYQTTIDKLTVSKDEYNALVEGGFIKDGDTQIRFTYDAIDYLESKGFKNKYDNYKLSSPSFSYTNMIDVYIREKQEM